MMMMMTFRPVMIHAMIIILMAVGTRKGGHKTRGKVGFEEGIGGQCLHSLPVLWARHACWRSAYSPVSDCAQIPPSDSIYISRIFLHTTVGNDLSDARTHHRCRGDGGPHREGPGKALNLFAPVAVEMVASPFKGLGFASSPGGLAARLQAVRGTARSATRPRLPLQPCAGMSTIDNGAAEDPPLPQGTKTMKRTVRHTSPHRATQADRGIELPRAWAACPQGCIGSGSVMCILGRASCPF